MTNHSDLPFSSEFSPSQIDLIHLLGLTKSCGGDWKYFEKQIREKYFEKNDTSDYNKGKLANNTKLSMIAYNIIERDSNFTEFGEKLYSLIDNEEKLYSELAKHILLNLNGINLLECVKDLQEGHEHVTLITIRESLEKRGLYMPPASKNASVMRAWLEKAGVLSGKWNINEQKLKRVLGVTIEEIDVLSILTQEQRDYLKTIASMENFNQGGAYQSNRIKELAHTRYGTKFNEKSLPTTVLYPLQNEGYITLERGTKVDGRGAKPFIVKPTEKLVSEVMIPILEQIEKQTLPEIRPMLRKPFSKIKEEINSSDTHIKGLALEAFAFKLMQLLDLTYVKTRLKGDSTGGAEVDLIFETTRLVFSRWQVQCKNTSSVNLDPVAKEVGLTHLLKSNVIVIVSTGKIGSEARRYANTIMKDSNLCIIMVDEEDIKMLESDPSNVVEILNREAESAMKIKALDK